MATESSCEDGRLFGEYGDVRSAPLRLLASATSDADGRFEWVAPNTVEGAEIEAVAPDGRRGIGYSSVGAPGHGS